MSGVHRRKERRAVARTYAAEKRGVSTAASVRAICASGLTVLGHIERHLNVRLRGEVVDLGRLDG